MKALPILFLLVLSVAPVCALAEPNSWELRASHPPRAEALPPGASLAPLLKVTSDRDSSVYQLGFLRDAQGAPLGLGMTPNGKGPSATTPYLFTDIASADGVTLFESGGRKVLLLQGALNEAGTQGKFHLRYLSNGLFMSYGTCDVLLESQGGTLWMQNAYTGAKITAVKIITSVFGVDTLQGVCPAGG